MVEAVDGGDFTADVVIAELMMESVDCWMLRVTAEYFFGFLLSKVSYVRRVQGVGFALTDLSGL